MDILLYNPLSRNGKNPKFIKKVSKKINKSGDVLLQNILDIDDVDLYIKGLKDDDRVIIIGGDGTLNRIVNRIYDKTFKQEIYMYRGGTGNDFIRSLKTKKHMVPLKSYIKDLPVAIYNDKEIRFLNGAGIGVDGYVGHLINQSDKKKNQLNYFKHALKAFGVFKPMEATLTLDGKTIHEKRVWLVSVMHGAYYGGGMKVAPMAKRNEKALHVVMLKDIPKWLLIMIFPTIYLGWHPIFKRYVSFYKVDHVALSFKEDAHMQIDGEHDFPVREMICHT
ncbi:MAG: diacylglycerol/lipid kinase family protein [Acholeplasmataceae bacterium]